eukprot:TCONS_00058128-protein
MGVNEVADRNSPPALNMETLLQNKSDIKLNGSTGKYTEDVQEEEDYDFYRFIVSDFHGIARSKLVTKSAYKYMKKRGPGIAWKTVLLSFDNYFNCEAKRLDGERCTDARLTPAEDLSVPRSLPWAGEGYKIAGVLCETWWGIDGLRQQACPRYMARRLCDQLESEFGLRIFHGTEMEFTLFKEKGVPEFDDGGLYIPQELDTVCKELLPLSKHCEAAGIPIETLQTEFGPGQLEVVLKPAYGIEGADNSFLFKCAAKEILAKPGFHGRATFMSKPIIDKVGSSNHFNHSLWKVKDNGELEDSMWDGTQESKLTKTAQHWLAGILKHTPALAAIFNPTVNDWRRLHITASTRDITTPHYITWGIENRLTLIRVIARGAGKATYLENRLPGATMNPYLALAGMVAAGIDGIRNKIELPAPGNTENEFGVLPGTLEEALDALKSSSVMREHLGDEFVNWFVCAKEKEIEVLNEYTDKNGGDSFQTEVDFYSKWI